MWLGVGFVGGVEVAMIPEVLQILFPELVLVDAVKAKVLELLIDL